MVREGGGQLKLCKVARFPHTVKREERALKVEMYKQQEAGQE